MQQMITSPAVVTWRILNIRGRAQYTIMLRAEIITRYMMSSKVQQNDEFANSWVLPQRKCNDDFDQV